MENTTHKIEWARHFDRAYCFHYLPQAHKLPRLVSELERVGLAQSGILNWRYTSHSRYDDALFRFANERRTALDTGCVNLGLAALQVLEECLAFRLQRVLFLENDIAFLKDPAHIEAILEAMPSNADIWQMDNFVAPNGEGQYKRLKLAMREGTHFFNASKAVFYSGACFALSYCGMLTMRDILSDSLQPPDSCFIEMERRRCKRVVSDTNMAIQLVYASSISARMWGVMSHHDGYRRCGVDYSRYNVPEGYGTGESERSAL